MILLGLLALQMFGRERIEGKVRCEDVGVMAAVVNAFPSNTADTVPSASTFTDLEGKFSLEVDTLPVRLHISARGYNPKEMTVSSSPVLVNLEMKENELGEVVVKARRLNMKSIPGGFSFNPSAVYSEARNASDVFEYVPVLNIADNRLSIVSKSGKALILINGVRPSYPQELVLDKLHALRPEDIKQIEILTSPGPSYTPEEIANGVINVILEDRYRGANGGVAANLMWYDNGLRYIGPRLYGFYQNHNVLFSVSGDYTHSSTVNDWKRHLLDTSNGLERLTESQGGGHRNQMGIKASGELRLPHSQILTLTVAAAGKAQSSGTTVKESAHSMVEGDTWGVSELDTHSPFKMRLGVGMRYRKAFNATGTTSLEARLSWTIPSWSDNISTLTSHTVTPYGEEWRDRIQSSRVRTQQYSGILQFNHRFKDGSSFEAVASVANAPYTTEYTDPEDAFRFERDITLESVSVNYSKEWSSVFNTRIGLRQIGYFRRMRLWGDEERYNYNKFLLLPDISASLSLGGGRHNLNLNWCMSDSQPSTEELNPYKYWLSANEYRTGNPELGLTAQHFVNLEYSFLGDLLVDVGYNDGRYINSNYRYVMDDGTLVNTYLDSGKSRMVSMLANYTRWLFNYRWMVSAFGVVDYYDASTDSPTGSFSQKSWNWMFDVRSTVRVLKKPKLNWSVGYRYEAAKHRLGYTDSSKQRIDTGLTSEPWKDADLNASISIPLTGESRTYETPGLVESTRKRFDKYVNISLTLTWRFGKTSIQRAEFVNTGT